MTNQETELARTGQASKFPIASWPEAFQQTFHASAKAMGWSSSYSARVARALDQLFQFMCSQNCNDEWSSGPSKQSWQAYIEALEQHYTATTALTYRELAAHGLCAVYRNEIFQDIIDGNRTERQRLTRKPCKPKSCHSASKRKSLNVEDWPKIWQTNWHKAFETKTSSSLRALLEQDGTAVQGNGKLPQQWSVAYRNRVARGLGLLAGWMKSRHVTEVSQAGIQDCIAELAHQSPKSVLTYLQEIHRGLLILELHPDPEWLADEIAWLKRRAQPRGRQDKLLPLGQLRAGAMAHLKKVEQLPVSRQTASRYRDALILALLTYRPDRVADFHSLALGKTVHVNDESAQLYVMQAKTHQGKSSEWPAELQAPLQRYLDVYRPLLSWGYSEDALWLSGKTGSPLSQSRLASIVRQLTTVLFGKSLSPHFIRNVYATSFAEENPDHLPDVSMMLGHRDERAIVAYTIHARSVGAANALNDVIEEL